MDDRNDYLVHHNGSEAVKLIGLDAPFQRPNLVGDTATSPIESSPQTDPVAASADTSTACDAMDEVRLERMAYLRKCLADKNYSVATEEIADKVLDYLLGPSEVSVQNANLYAKARQA